MRRPVLSLLLLSSLTFCLGLGAQAMTDSDEAFSRLGATIAIADGVASTDDLKFEATDLALTTAGRVNLTSLTLDFKGRVQLSEALSKQSNATLVSVTGDQGRITLPATISGNASAPLVRIDAGDMAKRALRNAANVQGQKLLNQQSEKLLKGNPEAQKLLGGRIGGLLAGKK